MVESYKDLQVWQKARMLVKNVYVMTKKFPPDELYGLAKQLRRAVVSIPSNIAEGSSKRSTKEFMRFLNIAYGSLCEVETQIILAFDLEYIDQQILSIRSEEIAELGHMINGLLRSLNDRLNSTELRTLNSELSDA